MFFLNKEDEKRQGDIRSGKIVEMSDNLRKSFVKFMDNKTIISHKKGLREMVYEVESTIDISPHTKFFIKSAMYEKKDPKSKWWSDTYGGEREFQILVLKENIKKEPDFFIRVDSPVRFLGEGNEWSKIDKKFENEYYYALKKIWKAWKKSEGI